MPDSGESTAWVALLRGVNVNGITVRSADLAALFRETLGFDAGRTVLASGNVRFEDAADVSARATVKGRIEAALRERFGYDAWIVLITLEELRRALDAFPFDASAADRQPYVVFASGQAVIDELAAAAANGLGREVDPVHAGHGVLYWNPARGASTTTPFAKILARPAYRSTTTTRNLRTLLRLST